MAEMSVIWLRVAAALYSLGLLHAILMLVREFQGGEEGPGKEETVARTESRIGGESGEGKGSEGEQSDGRQGSVLILVAGVDFDDLC